MKKFKKWFALGACLVMAMGCMTLFGCGGSEEPTEGSPGVWADADVPEDVQALVDEVKGYADYYVEELGTDFGDRYKELVESGEGEDSELFAGIYDQLNGCMKHCGATYMYALNPADADGNPVLDSEGGEGTDFVITVDGSDDPDPWAENYGWEIQFTEAWNGEAAAARSAWYDDDEGTVICWSAFAPIKDSEGNVVGILGIDYPADIIADYPEWCRDAAEWNGIEQ